LFLDHLHHHRHHHLINKEQFLVNLKFTIAIISSNYYFFALEFEFIFIIEQFDFLKLHCFDKLLLSNFINFPIYILYFTAFIDSLNFIFFSYSNQYFILELIIKP
jgi:hypothetical protein